MSKRSFPSCAVLHCGIDVSAATLAVAVQPEGSDDFQQREFARRGPGRAQAGMCRAFGPEATVQKQIPLYVSF